LRIYRLEVGTAHRYDVDANMQLNNFRLFDADTNNRHDADETMLLNGHK
jgi:hypothetical protein